MDKKLYYYTVVLLAINGLLLCNGANDASMNNVAMVASDQNYPYNNNRATINEHATRSRSMDSAEAKPVVQFYPTPAPTSTTTSPSTATVSTMLPPATATFTPIPSAATATVSTMLPPATATFTPIPSAATATVSTMLPPATATFTPIPSAATATMKPGGNDMSKIINLLFVIMLVVTAILMAITGFCMMGLRRRYLIVSEQPRYEQLKPIPI